MAELVQVDGYYIKDGKYWDAETHKVWAPEEDEAQEAQKGFLDKNYPLVMGGFGLVMVVLLGCAGMVGLRMLHGSRPAEAMPIRMQEGMPAPTAVAYGAPQGAQTPGSLGLSQAPAGLQTPGSQNPRTYQAQTMPQQFEGVEPVGEPVQGEVQQALSSIPVLMDDVKDLQQEVTVLQAQVSMLSQPSPAGQR
jgi:hypothetical protein